MKDHESIDELENSSSSQRDRVQTRRKHRSGHHGEDGDGGPQVIARIPRLDRHREAVSTGRSSRTREPRLLGTRVSAWTIVGGVGFLIVAAVLSSLVSRTFQSKSEPAREASHRPEAPAPDAPPAPRWAATVPSSDSNPASDSNLKAADPPSFTKPSTGLSIATSGQNQGNPSAIAPVAPPGAPVPWQPVPGARSPEVLPGGALGSLPANPPVSPPPSAGRMNYEDERFPARGGLVNAIPPVSRDSQPVDPRTSYRYAPAADNRQDYRSTAEARPDYRAGLSGEPRPDYRPAAFDSRPDYRVADRPRYPEASPSRSEDPRGDSPDYRRYQDYPNPRSRGLDAGAYPTREQTVGYETGATPGGRPPMAGRPGSPSSTGPEWVSPPNWVTPPAWDSPVASNPGRSPQSPVSGAPSYPATGFPGPESWAIGNGPVGGQGVSPPAEYAPARFEGSIERPTNRMSHEHTGSSIR
mgnify:CR=1 FL=1